MSIFVLESPGGVEEFARAYAHYVGASTVKALPDELRDLLKEGVMLMADRIYFVDAVIPADEKKKGKNKTHVVFDGGRVFRVRRMTELEDAGEILIDALFPELYDEILELLRRGAKVYLLKDATKLKRLRMENKMRKCDENDVIILARMPEACFKELTIRDVTLLQLIDGYEKFTKWGKVIRQWMKSYPLDSFNECIRELRSMHDCYGRKIIDEVMRNDDYAAIYRMACDELELKDSVEVAILVARLPLNWKLRRLKGLLGLTPHRSKKYHYRLRNHLSKLAATIYINNGRYGICAKLFEGINRTPQSKALHTLQLRILRILKGAWQQRQRMLAGGQ